MVRSAVRWFGFAAAVLLGVSLGGGLFSASPAAAERREPAKEVTTGSHHTCTLLTSGRVTCWGSNQYGQLGDGTINDSLTPVTVKGIGGVGHLSGVVQLTADRSHTCALLRNRTVACWGGNDFGELGDGTYTRRATPVLVDDVGGGGELGGILQISAGARHTCALRNNNTPVCWGRNYGGQLGNGTNTNTTAPVAVKAPDGEQDLVGITQIVAAGHHSCGLETEGRVLCWGANYDGQLGDGTTTDSNIPVVVRGIGGEGELNHIEQIADGYRDTCAVFEDETAVCWGGVAQSSMPKEVRGVNGASRLIGVKQIASGPQHSCALLARQRVACWGANYDGQLGDGTFLTSNFEPVPVAGIGGDGELTRVKQLSSASHTCALQTNRQVVCWGRNGVGQVGDGSTTNRGFPVTAPSPLSLVREVQSGANHNCALLTNRSVSCWGSNTRGQLGNGTTTNRAEPQPVMGIGGEGVLRSALQVSAGFDHTCALLASRNVACWGSNDNGKLGNGTTTDSFTPIMVLGLGGQGELGSVKKIQAGDSHTCATLLDRRVVCWGDNSSGQLGDGTTADSTTPVSVKGTSGDGQLSSVQDITTGSAHTCALLRTRQVACWGNNTDHQLGDASLPNSSTPQLVQAVGGGGELRAVREISAGLNHTCALLTNRRSVCWGSNFDGQLGDGTIEYPGEPVVVRAVGGGRDLTGVRQVTGGHDHSCAVVPGRKAACWGANYDGQLGGGTTTPLPLPSSVVGTDGDGELRGVKQISAGQGHTCALLTNRTVVCWGANGFGQLGTGTFQPSRTPVTVITRF